MPGAILTAPYSGSVNSTIAPTHITGFIRIVFDLRGHPLFDPGNKSVQQYVTAVVRDLVSRYDIDALHFDDYFYPYRIAGKEFPDDLSYRKYGNGMAKEDWRRSNVDSIIVMLGKAIREEKKILQIRDQPIWHLAQ